MMLATAAAFRVNDIICVYAIDFQLWPFNYCLLYFVLEILKYIDNLHNEMNGNIKTNYIDEKRGR